MKIVIQLKGRPWIEIEQFIASLSFRCPWLATSNDILPHLEIVGLIFPSPLQNLIAEYAIPIPYNSIFQLRTYALFKTGRIKDALACISTLRFGFTSEYAWLNRLGVEAYYNGQYEVASRAWMCSVASSEGHNFENPNSALARVLKGIFATALSITRTMDVEDGMGPGNNQNSWKLLIRGMSFAGIGMHEEALRELCKCISNSQMPYITALAVAFKNAIDERAILPPLAPRERTQWALDVHRIAAQSQPSANTSGWFGEEDSVTYVISY